MCLSLRQLDWSEVRRLITGKETKPITVEVEKKKTPKFPSRERNYAVRRKKTNNNNVRRINNCECCARAEQDEQR